MSLFVPFVGSFASWRCFWQPIPSQSRHRRTKRPPHGNGRERNVAILFTMFSRTSSGCSFSRKEKELPNRTRRIGCGGGRRTHQMIRMCIDNGIWKARLIMAFKQCDKDGMKLSPLGVAGMSATHATPKDDRGCANANEIGPIWGESVNSKSQISTPIRLNSWRCHG